LLATNCPTKRFPSCSYQLKVELMRYSNLIFSFGLMTALVGLTGCAGKVRYPSYYALSVPAPPSLSDPPKPSLGSVAVREFSAPRYLKGGSIVYRPSTEQLDFYDYHRWAEDPRRAVTQAMIRELQARGLFESVDLYDGRVSSQCLITGTLDHLEEIDQGSHVSIQVSVSAQLINLRTGEELWRDSLTKTATLDQRSVPGVVSEMSRQLGNAVAGLAASMKDHVSTTTLSLNREQ
jgi:uncharacterized lipoprotein YmbA